MGLHVNTSLHERRGWVFARSAVSVTEVPQPVTWDILSEKFLEVPLESILNGSHTSNFRITFEGSFLRHLTGLRAWDISEIDCRA